MNRQLLSKRACGMLLSIPCLLLTVLFTLLPLAGCSKAKEPVKLPDSLGQMMESYETAAEIAYGNLNATARIEKQNKNKLLINFEKPDSLKGLQAVLENGGLTVQYGSMSVDLSKLPLGDSFVGSLIEDAINKAAKNEGINVSLAKGQFLINGKTDQGSYQLVMDEKSGFLVTLDYPEMNFHVKFYEFRFAKQPAQNSADVSGN